jgi:hypothetical protein
VLSISYIIEVCIGDLFPTKLEVNYEPELEPITNIRINNYNNEFQIAYSSFQDEERIVSVAYI